MGSDVFSKRVPLDHIVNLYNDKINVDVLFDDQREHIVAVIAFLCPSRQVMESLATDRKTYLDLVFVSITHLIKHCENGETTLKDINQDLTTVGMKAKLQQYEKLLIQELAIVAAYLNP
ncbi:unnamed protein product [Sphagnum jensenii]|uniref:Uncharacterized protein n=1 Tax=Sphagnum jensenii TaxID=128206 RepID=A0ABP0X2Q9_9BRYO